MATKLDPTDNRWEPGDDLRIIDALELPFSQYTQECVGECCMALADLSEDAVDNVRNALAKFEAAQEVVEAENLSNNTGETLVKADVLEWEPVVDMATGPRAEMARNQGLVLRYFSSCTCLSGLLPDTDIITRLERS